MPVIGVAGHVDHGKTALVRALTGTETDRLPEEQARGISIALGFAHVDGVDLVDMPGHERFVRTMVAGATGMDALLLVVDAREGVMPQTREHVHVASLLGVGRALVAVSRIDLAEPHEAEAAARAASALVADAGLRAGAPVPVSARTGQGIAQLRAAIAAEARDAQPRADEGAPWLPVDRAFSVPGHGTVATGTLRRGTLAAGETVEIVPSGIEARIRALQTHGARVTAARPGQRVAVNLRAVEPAQLPRGAALCAPGALPAAEWLSVQLRSVPDGSELATTQLVRLLFGTAEVEARLRLPDREVLRPGEVAPAQLRCLTPVSVPSRERFVLRLPGSGTVGGGTVLDPAATRARRHDKAVLARLSALAEAGPEQIVTGELTRAGVAGVAVRRLARLAGTAEARAVALLPPDAATLRGDAFSGAALDALSRVLPRVLAPYAEGVARETLAALLPKAGRTVMDAALAQLLRSGVVAQDGAAFRLRRPEQDAAAARTAERQAGALADMLRRAGLSPPDPDILAPDLARRRLLDRLVREGVLVRAPDRVQKREILFHRDAVRDACVRLSTLLGSEGKLVGEVGAALGISRKYSVPLLEHLDSVRFTRRVGERRVLVSEKEELLS